MGLFSSLGGALRNGLRLGVAQGIKDGLKLAAYESAGGNGYEYYKHADAIPTNLYSLQSTNSNTKQQTENDDSTNTGMKPGNAKNIKENGDVLITKYIKDDAHRDSDKMDIDVPNWGYDDFINTRAIFQKGIHSPFSLPGFFYFKVFFKFDTQHGLFGGILNNGGPSGSDHHYTTQDLQKDAQGNITKTTDVHHTENIDGIYVGTNTAAKYLSVLHHSKRYKMSVPGERLNALVKFTNMLSHISCKEPWYIKSIKGLGQADSIKLEDMSKEKVIEIGMGMEAIDMRLTTMFDLYRFACYDMANCREIIPDNLRKFEMQVVVFNVPLKNFHQALKTDDGTFKYKRLEGDEKMSYKVYTFQNCEFDIESFGSGMPDLDVEKAGELGHHTIKIKYDRVFTTTSAEFYDLLLSPSGFIPTYNSKHNSRMKALQDAILNNKYHDKNGEYSKDVIGASEAIAQNALAEQAGRTLLGNIYAEDAVPGFRTKKYDNAQVSIAKGGKLGSYYKTKLKYLKTRGMESSFMTDGFNILLNKILGGRGMAITSLGNIYGSIGNNGNYIKDKIKNLKRGTLYAGYSWTPPSEADLRSQEFDRFRGGGYRVNKSTSSETILPTKGRERRTDALQKEQMRNKAADIKKGWQNEVVGVPGNNTTTMTVSEHQYNMAESIKDGTIPSTSENDHVEYKTKLEQMTERVKNGNGDVLSTVEADHVVYKSKMSNMAERVKNGNGDIVANVQADHQNYLDEIQQMTERVKQGNGDVLSTVENDHAAYKAKMSNMVDKVKNGNGDVLSAVEADHVVYKNKLQQMTERVKQGNGDIAANVENDHTVYKTKMSTMAEKVKQGNGDVLSTVESDHVVYKAKMYTMTERVKQGNGDITSNVEADHIVYKNKLEQMTERVKQGNGDITSNVEADHIVYKNKLEQMTERVKQGNGDVLSAVEADHQNYLDEIQQMSERVKNGDESITSGTSSDAISERGNLKAKLEALKNGTL